MAQKLKAQRHERGALDLQTLEARPVFAGDEIQDLQVDETNRAKEIIEDFMIAANDVTARFLHGKKIPSLRRVVRSPKRWDRIVEIAAQHNFSFRRSRIRRRWRVSWPRRKPPTRSVFPIFLCPSSNCSAPVNMSSNSRMRRLPATSAWPSKITPTQRLPTAGFRT